MANDGLFADVRDKLLETLDTDEALTAWLTAHNGHKYFCRPTDKLALDLVALNCPAIIIKPAGTILGYATNAWMQAILRFRITLASKKQDSDDLHDLLWLVTQCLVKEKLAYPPLGISEVFWMGFMPSNVVPAHEDQAMQEAGVMWQEAIEVTIYLRYDPQAEP